MDKIISKDGVSIAYQRLGKGPALILVHGANGDFSHWAWVQPTLAQYFSVYAIDRRGRGESGDATDYSIQSEYDDVSALANSIDGPVDILGHSFGAACVLGAVKAVKNLRRLVLYEPPLMPSQIGAERGEMLKKMDAALQAGNLDEIVTILMRDLLLLPQPLIEQMRKSPGWAKTLPLAKLVPREIRASPEYASDLNVIESIQAPTLLIQGGDSQPSFKQTVATLHHLIPNSRLVVLKGQQHTAMMTAPDIFAKEVIRFLLE